MNVLIVAAHPDDEVLGVGGAIACHAAQGDTVHILIVAEGATSRDGTAEGGVQALRESAAHAATVLGAEAPQLLGLPDNRLDTVALLDIIQSVEEVVRKTAPVTVYTHHGGDLNIDHRIVHQATVTACRPVPGSTVRQMFCFETPSSTEWSTPSMGAAFNPTHFVSIADTLDAKTAALKENKVLFDQRFQFR